ncbi:hypothetical protein KC19_10G051000 [Ceratodon purpureus]|uniref:Mitochondrial carrier protein n=1 Tax=Ceratodon purpureus TaxID=3225 RepID=A0A8T0GLY2_CERPU|nr:hypothetical protein KC19_10G051000 [Ceratodon purpureus]
MAGVGDSSHEHLAAKQMLAGGIGGALADGTMYPMMTVKSRLQVQGGSGGGASALYMYRGPVQAIQTIVAKEGWRTFYKGYATVTQVAPAQALYFGTYQAIKRYLPGGHDSPVVQFAGGILASLVQSTVTVPVEVIRQRQMVQTAGEGSYTGSLHTARSIYQYEGVGAFYRGFLLNQMVWVPFNAVYLPLWEASKRACARFSGAGSVEKLDVRYELGSAFLCSAFAAGLTNPMDVIKTRLQVQGKSNVHSTTEYSGAWDAARTIYKHEGMGGFARGMTSRMLWVAPSAMIMFTTYDQMMKWLAHDAT